MVELHFTIRQQQIHTQENTDQNVSKEGGKQTLLNGSKYAILPDVRRYRQPHPKRRT